ncbi:hypothetical protein BGZ70_006793, partial [Mortierella alpina]
SWPSSMRHLLTTTIHSASSSKSFAPTSLILPPRLIWTFHPLLPISAHSPATTACHQNNSPRSFAGSSECAPSFAPVTSNALTWTTVAWTRNSYPFISSDQRKHRPVSTSLSLSSYELILWTDSYAQCRPSRTTSIVWPSPRSRFLIPP